MHSSFSNNPVDYPIMKRNDCLLQRRTYQTWMGGGYDLRTDLSLTTQLEMIFWEGWWREGDEVSPLGMLLFFFFFFWVVFLMGSTVAGFSAV